MGMDIYGTAPTSEAGEYFRANIWSWPPILGLARTAIETFGLGFDTELWAYNDGAGLESQEDCNKLADAMQRLVGGLESPVLVSDHLDISNKFMMAMGGIAGVKPQAEASVEHAQEFITFLRDCGGFRIC